MRTWPLLFVVGCAAAPTASAPVLPRPSTAPTLCDSSPPDPRAVSRRAEFVRDRLERAVNRIQGRDPALKPSEVAFRRARGAACGHVAEASKLRRSDDATLGVAACHTADVIDDGRSRIVPLALSADGRSSLLFVHLEAETGRATWWSDHVAHVSDDVVALVESTGAGPGGATPTGRGIALGPTGDFDEDGVPDVLATEDGPGWHMMSVPRPAYGPTVQGLPRPAAPWKGISNPVLGLLQRGRTTYLLAAEHGLLATCAQHDETSVDALHWASDTSSFVRTKLARESSVQLADWCRGILVLGQLDPTASPAPVAADLEQRRAWVSKLMELARRADLPSSDFAAVLQADAGLKPCAVAPK